MTSTDPAKDAQDPTIVRIKECLASADSSHYEAAKLMKELEGRGWSQRRIAKAVGCSQKTVSSHVIWYDLPEPRPTYGQSIRREDDQLSDSHSEDQQESSQDQGVPGEDEESEEEEEDKGQSGKDPLDEVEDSWAFAGSFLATAIKFGKAPASEKTRKNIIRDCKKAIELMESVK